MIDLIRRKRRAHLLQECTHFYIVETQIRCIDFNELIEGAQTRKAKQIA
jgi:hypothetical protein